MAFRHNSVVAKREPQWGSMDKSKLPRVAFARQGEPDQKSTWGFPHHWVSGGKDMNGDGIFDTGTLFLHRGGLNAAWSAANGGRSGKKAEPAVLSHLRKHFKDLGVTQAELHQLSPDVNFSALTQELDTWDETNPGCTCCGFVL